MSEFTADQVCEAIAHAIEAHDLEVVPSLIAYLATIDPRRAQEVYDVIQIGISISDSPSPAASSDGPLSVSPDAPDRGDGIPHAVPAEFPHGGGDAGGVPVVDGGLDTWTRAGADTGWWTGARI